MNRCIFCEDELINIPNEDSWPYEGGKVQFVFSFGSSKFDKCLGNTIYRGVICDHCASKFVNRMDETLEE